MIGKLTGRVDEVTGEHALIDVHGVGYLVSAPGPTLERLPRGEVVSLIIETHVREDAIRLYGFANGEERDWFRLLQTVQGVGAKVALAVLSVCPGPELARAVALGDKARVARAAGVGAKLAQRIVSELKDKVPALALVAAGPAPGAAAARGAAPAGPAAEAVSALANLGYAPLAAAEAVAAAQADLGEGAPLDALIRAGLKALAR